MFLFVGGVTTFGWSRACMALVFLFHTCRLFCVCYWLHIHRTQVVDLHGLIILCRYILRGHTGIVHCLSVVGNRLYSGGGTRDKWVRVSEFIQFSIIVMISFICNLDRSGYFQLQEQTITRGESGSTPINNV